MAYCGVFELHVYDNFFLGLTAMCFLIVCSRAAKLASPGRDRWLLGAFESTFAVALGAFSYSLYLVHFPILSMTNALTYNLGCSLLTRMLVVLFGGVPLAVGIAYLFHLAFERWCMASHPRSIAKASDGLKPALCS